MPSPPKCFCFADVVGPIPVSALSDPFPTATARGAQASHEAHEASKAEAQRTESEAAVDESAFAQDGFRRLLLIEYEDGRLFVHDGHHRGPSLASAC